MFTENNIFIRRSLAALLILLCLPLFIGAKKNLFEFTSSKGLKIKILKDDNLLFSHGELIIFYRDKTVNPAVPVLILENMFNRDMNKTDTDLLGILRRLGNDYEIVNRGDYLKLKINFLSDKIHLFAQLLKEIYNYKSFTLDKFKDSVDNYWNYSLKSREWQQKVAFQIAYRELFPQHLLGNTLVSSDPLKDVKFAQILVFYNDIYTPENSLLFVKGDVDPFLLFGNIQKTFRTYKKRTRESFQEEPLTVAGRQKVIIFDTDTPEPPKIYWFESIPPLNGEAHLRYRIINNILFGFPTGILFRTAGYFGMRNIRIETELIHHRDVSIICNTVSRLSYQNIEKFILLAESEKKKLRIKTIDRKEYLNARNYFYGKFKVETDQFDYDLRQEIQETILAANNGNSKPSAHNIREMLTRISLNSLNQMIVNPKAGQDEGRNLRGSIIIIAGNEKSLRRHLNILKPVNAKIKIK
jgi:hypothetical protein